MRLAVPSARGLVGPIQTRPAGGHLPDGCDGDADAGHGPGRQKGVSCHEAGCSVGSGGAPADRGQFKLSEAMGNASRKSKRSNGNGQEALARPQQREVDEIMTGENGTSILIMEAAENGRLHLVRYVAEDFGQGVNATDEDGSTALMKAARKGHLEVVRYLTQDCGVDVDTRNQSGDTALTLAALTGQVAVVQFLVDCGADATIADRLGRTALMRAAEEGHLEIARYLTENGAIDVNSADMDGVTALMHAASNDHAEIVLYLAHNSAEVNVTDEDGATALMWAASSGHAELVRFLVEERGADVNATNSRGGSALMWAAGNGHLEVVRYLVEQRSMDVNTIDELSDTALMWAARSAHATVVQYLAEHGADVTAKDEHGRTGLMKAAERGHLDVVRYLAHHCCINVNAVDENGDTAITYAAGKGYVDPVRYMAEQLFADVDTRDKHGCTPLMWAARNGHIDAVRYLAKRCTDKNATDEDGNTALIKAAENGHADVVRYLTECNADANVSNSRGDTALMKATEEGHLNVVKFLVLHNKVNANATNTEGSSSLMRAVQLRKFEVAYFLARQPSANVNLANNNGFTALAYAAKWGHINLVRCLTELGADANIKDRYGDTALMKAAVNGRLDIVQYLTRFGADVNAVDKDGDTALIWAAERGHIDVVTHFVEQCNANINASNNSGLTALMYAAERGHVKVVRCLTMQCSIDLNAKSEAGDTALMKAVAEGYIEVARLLSRQRGIDVNSRNNRGETAIGIAVDGGHQEIQRLLTPLFRPVSQPPKSGNIPDNTLKMVQTKGLRLDRTSYTISPFEIELVHFSKKGNIGGNYRAKWLDADAVVKLYISDAFHLAFEEEVRRWHQLRHPNVVKMYGACDAGTHLKFFVCEYASKGSLLDHVWLNPDQRSLTLKFLHEAALGLAYLRERKIFHGDIRCSNVLIGRDNLAKLSNFALSSPASISGETSPHYRSTRWQAPEVLKGMRPSFESDVYSLGMCILEAVTRHVPWSGQPDDWMKKYKMSWSPESSSGNEPYCMPGDVHDLVWCMCCQDPYRRVSLSSVVYELEHLYSLACSSSENSRPTQPDPAPTNLLDDCNSRKTDWLWLLVLERMESCDNHEYCQAFLELKRFHERLQNATCHPTLLAQFNALLTDFEQTVNMSSEQIRIMQLSSSCATINSVQAFQWRMRSVLACLGESESALRKREVRWQQQRSTQIELFVLAVSDTYLLLQRAAFLKTLKAEIENRVSKYTPAQIGVMKKAYEEIASKVESDDLSELIPEWFIPWYELIVDKSKCLGNGGFGSVYRAKWLDSDVVVKHIKLLDAEREADSSFLNTSQSSLSACMGPSPSQAQVNASKKAEALEMFRREVDIWFGFSHPHVVRLFGACHVGRPFFVCEYATNGTLVSYLQKHPNELWAKLYESALGVQYLHARGVVHGDLKGDNVVIGSDMKAKVTDFGLSSIASTNAAPQISAALCWVAPECLRAASARPTFASDIYSLGMCIVQALRVVEAVTLGHDSRRCLPWANPDPMAVRYNATHGILPSRPSACEDNMWDLVRRMCALEPAQRIKISTVVDELARRKDNPDNYATATEPIDVMVEPFSHVSAAARELLARVEREDPEGDDSVVSLYFSMWDRIEQVYALVGENASDECQTELGMLVAKAKAATFKLPDRSGSLIDIAETTMRCYALQRRLEKFQDAYCLAASPP
ncbi:unnamed protein product [Phytophthora lilii]|uniref:Unnamed protein product n=1 Tax=Phytophthora lilii TaxID=2077276 RepID=A0A9W6TI86_9STRA|nr:unnamed protein product [Phytophthora lilii]